MRKSNRTLNNRKSDVLYDENESLSISDLIDPLINDL